jgi:LysM repeat protein
LTIEVDTNQPIRPSATPFFHIVVEEDTLLGIALRYGLELDDLLNANPGINPRILSIGQEIQIPNPEGTPGVLLPTATPFPLEFSEVICYESLSNSNWCLIKAMHTNSSAIEAVSAMISLYDQHGELINSALATAPHNLLPPGVVMPLGVYFPERIPVNSHAEVQVVSAFAVGTTSDRFLSFHVSWLVEPVEFFAWTISGEVTSLPANLRPSTSISVLISAFGASDDLVGFLKEEFDVNVKPGGSFSFEMEVYSLGPSIERIEVLVEDVSEFE